MMDCELDSCQQSEDAQAKKEDMVRVALFELHPDAKARLDQLEERQRAWAQRNQDASS